MHDLALASFLYLWVPSNNASIVWLNEVAVNNVRSLAALNAS
jgi:hypothetical protein